MTPLERALRERISSEGPITVEAFMQACNDYYYATRDPLGAAGDFTTAPEISQMFGELAGACLADCWRRAGSPDDAVYAEMGPGRGTLAADALRVMRKTGFSGDVHFLETSPALKVRQAEAVPGALWHSNFSELPEAPLLLVANEFLDALPVRQCVDGIERRVVLAGDGLAFDRDGPIIETSPAREETVREVAEKVVTTGGIALIIDYGHEHTSVGDTLQAVRGHQFAPVLLNPGEQDLTAHVDFEAIGRVAVESGAAIAGPVEQGRWLRALGIEARTNALAKAHPERASQLAKDAARLCDDDQMGKLFKVMAIHSPGWPTPAGFAP